MPAASAIFDLKFLTVVPIFMTLTDIDDADFEEAYFTPQRKVHSFGHQAAWCLVGKPRTSLFKFRLQGYSSDWMKICKPH